MKHKNSPPKTSATLHTSADNAQGGVQRKQMPTHKKHTRACETSSPAKPAEKTQQPDDSSLHPQTQHPRHQPRKPRGAWKAPPNTPSSTHPLSSRLQVEYMQASVFTGCHGNVKTFNGL